MNTLQVGDSIDRLDVNGYLKKTYTVVGISSIGLDFIIRLSDINNKQEDFRYSRMKELGFEI